MRARLVPFAGRMAALGLLVIPTLSIYYPRSLAVAVGLVGLAVGTAAWPHRPWPRPSKVIAAIFGALVVWAAASCLWAVDAGAALRDTAVVASVCVGALICCCAAAALAEERRRLLLAALAVGLTLALATTAVELAFDGVLLRFRATYLSDLGGVMKPGNTVAMVLLPPVLAGLATLGRRRSALALGVGWVAVVPFLFSESAKLSMATMMLVLVLVWRLPRLSPRLLAAGMVALVMVLPFLSLAGPAPIDIWEDYPWLKNSAHHRLSIWRFTSEHIVQHPVIGWGMSGSRFIPNADEVIVYTRPIGGGLYSYFHEPNLPLHPHNAVLQWWLELGAVGALLAAAAVVTVLVGPAARLGPLAVANVMGAVAVMTTAYGAWQGWWLCVLALAAMSWALIPPRTHRS